MQKEVWKHIVVADGYEVSDQGRVRSYWARWVGGMRGEFHRISTPTIIKSYPTPYGHLRCHVGKGSQRQIKSVHRLVLEAFVGACPKGHCACHCDGDPANNILSNLRWDTFSNNTMDAVRHGTHRAHRGEKQKHSVLTASLVRRIRQSKGYISQQKWAAFIGCGRQTVQHAQNYESWRHVE